MQDRDENVSRSELLNEVQQLKSALAKSQKTVARYERIFAGAQNYGFMDWDLIANENYWSGQFWQSLGYSDEDISRLSKTEHFMEYIHPEDRVFLTNALMDHFHGKPHERTTFRILRKDGGFVWAEARGESERDEQGRIRFMSGLLFDINDLKGLQQRLKKSEERFARIVSASNEGYWEWTAEGNAFLFSPNCWEHLGYAHEEELFKKGEDTFQSWRSKVHPDDLPGFDATLRKQLSDREPIDFEYRMQAKDRSWRWLRVRGSVVFDERDRPSIMSGINIDVTELRVAQAKEAEARLLAERASQSKSRFLSSMSHELRTPLNAVIGFAQLLERDDSLVASQRQNAERIHKAGDHLISLIGDVLDLEKIDANVMDIYPMPCSLESILEDALMMLKDLKSSADISLHYENDLKQTSQICVDPNRLRQILINLISNAIKYNKKGGSVYIGMRSAYAEDIKRSVDASTSCPSNHSQQRLAEEDCWQVVTVTDTGVGIPKEKAKNLFKPFHRLGREKGRVEGTGIGLTIALQLVDLMDGLLWYESEEAEGSSFHVAFPELPAASSLHRTSSGGSAPQPIDANLRKDTALAEYLASLPDKIQVGDPLRVLHIEDNMVNQELLRSFCANDSRIAFYEAADASTGLYLTTKVRPHLILLDIELPDYSGYDFMELLAIYLRERRISFMPYVVAFSANALKKDIDRAMALGFKDYFTKPIDLARLDRLFSRGQDSCSS